MKAVWVQKLRSDKFVLENPASSEYGRHSSYLNLLPLFTGTEFFLYLKCHLELYVFSTLYVFSIRQRVITLTPALREILQIKAEEKTRPIEFNPSAFLDSRLTRKLRVTERLLLAIAFQVLLCVYFICELCRVIICAYSNLTRIELLDFICNVILLDGSLCHGIFMQQQHFHVD